MKPRLSLVLAFASALLSGLFTGCATPPQPTSSSPTTVESALASSEGATNDKGKKTMLPKTPPVFTVPAGKEVATIAGGCFWCTEAIFVDLRGVEKVVSGYSGGAVESPSYETVCNGTTEHAEAIQILFDPKLISYRDLLRIFLTTHDPTTLNQQGADTGTQYRSAIFTHSDEQKHTAKEVIEEVNKERIWHNSIVTEVTPYANFYKAEEYHQDYFAQNPTRGYCQAVIAPKVLKFRAKYRDKLKR